MGKWLLLISLLGLLALAVWVAHAQWGLVQVDLPPWAWAFMAVGLTLTVLVGAGLMALIFYSSRMGYDEPPHRMESDEEHHEHRP
jgi:uncharacterized integral membrane protein